MGRDRPVAVAAKSAREHARRDRGSTSNCQMVARAISAAVARVARVAPGGAGWRGVARVARWRGGERRDQVGRGRATSHPTQHSHHPAKHGGLITGDRVIGLVLR